MDGIRQVVGVIGVGLAMAVPSAALAQGVLGGPDSAWYAGGSVGQSASTMCQLPFGASCDDQGTAYRVFAGYKVNRYLSFELGYHELADVTLSAGPVTQTLETTVFDFVALGMLPLTDRFSGYGKLGIYRANAEASINTPAVPSAKFENTGLTYGLGLQYDVTGNLGVRLEWQQFEDAAGDVFLVSSSFSVTSIAAIWRFK